MKKFFFVFILIGCFIMLFASPLGNISQVNVNGANVLSYEDITTLISNEPTNIITFNNRRAVNNINTNPYVHRATISKNYFTRTLNINITERITVAYARFIDGNYLHIDKEGRVLAVSSYPTTSLPIVTSLNFTQFIVGQLLSETGGVETDFLTIAYLASIFITYEINQQTLQINASDANFLRLNYGNVIVSLGAPQNLHQKMRIVISTLPLFEAWRYLGGHLNISDVNLQWTFTVLT